MQSREDPYSQYAVKEDPYSQFEVKEDKPETFLNKLGFKQLPTEPIKQPIGSPNAFINPQTIEQLEGAAIGTPGMQEIGKVGTSLWSSLKNAFTKLKPYEEAVQNAGLEAETATKEAQKAKTGVLTNTPKNELESIEDQITRQLNTRGAHHLDLGSSLKNRIESVQNYWKDRYGTFLNNIKDKSVELNSDSLSNLDEGRLTEQDLIRKYPQEASDAIKTGKVDKFLKKYSEVENKENPYLEGIKEYAPTSEDTNAHTFLTKYKDFGTKLHKLGLDMNNPNIISSEKNKIAEALTKGHQMKESFKNALDEGLGEFGQEWKEVNKGYETQYYPLKNNTAAKSIVKNGKTSKDVIDQLGGSEEGQELLRNMIKSDPEMLRNALGQQYAKKSTNLFSPRADVQDYLNESPDIQKLLDQKEEALQRTSLRKDVGLKNKIKAEKELADIKKSRKNARSNLFKTALLGTSSVGIPYGYRSIASKIAQQGEE